MRRVLSQKALDRLLRRPLMLGLFPMLDECSVRRQRGELARRFRVVIVYSHCTC